MIKCGCGNFKARKEKSSSFLIQLHLKLYAARKMKTNQLKSRHDKPKWHKLCTNYFQVDAFADFKCGYFHDI